MTPMQKLKLSAIPDDNAVKLTVELPTVILLLTPKYLAGKPARRSSRQS
jgi:hypothetical protein